MTSLREISKQARVGDLILIETVKGDKGSLYCRDDPSLVLCEYGGLRLHQPNWNNIYEAGGKDFGWLTTTGNIIKIDPMSKTYKREDFYLGFTSKRFELGKEPIMRRLGELDMVHYAEAIGQGGLIKSKDIKKYQKFIGTLKGIEPSLNFKKDFSRKFRV